MASTHEKVTAPIEPVCLGPDRSAEVVIGVMRRLDGRWKLPILFRLFAGSALRFSELRRGLPGVSHKMLAERLRELEVDGLVIRVDHAEWPLRVDYRLSPRGESLRPVLAAMRDVGRSWQSAVDGTGADHRAPSAGRAD